MPHAWDIDVAVSYAHHTGSYAQALWIYEPPHRRQPQFSWGRMAAQSRLEAELRAVCWVLSYCAAALKDRPSENQPALRIHVRLSQTQRAIKRAVLRRDGTPTERLKQGACCPLSGVPVGV